MVGGGEGIKRLWRSGRGGREQGMSRDHVQFVGRPGGRLKVCFGRLGRTMRIGAAGFGRTVRTCSYRAQSTFE